MFQVTVGELHPVDCVLQAKTSNGLEVHYSQSPKSPVPRAQPETKSPELQDTSRETEEEEEGGSESSGLQVDETSVLSNGDLSEEEGLDNKSILPSSVLDQASSIAESFVSSLSRRSSLVSEDLGSLTCPSPSTDDVFRSSSACMNLEKQTQTLVSCMPQPQMSSEAYSSTPAHEHSLDILIEGERRSTLSKQDRLLIHKIRKYYEHAEHQDADFSVKRRESLSYIPAGLVRHLSRQLNGVPQDQAAPVHRKGLSRNRPTSWSVFDLPGLDKSRNAETQLKTEPLSPVEDNSHSTADGSSREEEFTSSSDMLKVWQDMEMEMDQDIQQIEKEKLNDSILEVTQHVSLDTSDVKTTEQLPQILSESEINSATDRTSIPSPSTDSPSTEGRSVLDSKAPTSDLLQERNGVGNGQLPKIISLRTSMDEDQILQDMGKMRNKVFQLARQYSQRIKNNRPMIWQRNRETTNQQGFKNMPAVHEEKMQLRKKGK